MQDLLFSAKHLFFAAMAVIIAQRILPPCPPPPRRKKHRLDLRPAGGLLYRIAMTAMTAMTDRGLALVTAVIVVTATGQDGSNFHAAFLSPFCKAMPA